MCRGEYELHEILSIEIKHNCKVVYMLRLVVFIVSIELFVIEIGTVGMVTVYSACLCVLLCV